MTPLGGADEVYRYLTNLRGPDGDGETDLIALFTFALVEQDRIEWTAHIVEQAVSFPTEAETRAWYASKPESYFADKIRRGEQWFTAFARTFLKDEVTADREQAVRNAIGGLRADLATAQTGIIGHIDTRTKSKGWGVSVSSGLIANFIFAFIVAILFFVGENRLSLGDIIADIAKGRVEGVIPICADYDV